MDVRTDEPERRFARDQSLRAEATGRIFRVVSARAHSGRLLVHFADLTDRTAAEAVRGTTLVAEVPRTERPVEPGEYYDRQLVGLQAHGPDGRLLGPVTAVIHLPEQDLLEIEAAGSRRLVPFVEALVPVVDLTAGTLTVDAPAGLLAEDPQE